MTNNVPGAESYPARRLFLGIEVPVAMQAQLARVRTDVPGARWQWPTDMHITLRFLGEMSAVQEAATRAIMRSLACRPFDLRIQGVGVFADKILWAAVAPSQPLVSAKQLIDERLSQQVIVEEESQAFVPHVTLARVPRGSQTAIEAFLACHHGMQLPPWTVEHVSLFISEPAGDGPVYRVIERFALNASTP